MVVAGIQSLAVATFWLLGAWRPRRGPGGWSGATWINVQTGLGLAVLRVVGTIVAIRWTRGLLPLDFLPSAGQVAIGFLTLDLARYGLHFAHHRVPFLWSFHRVHHSSETLDATSGFRMHVVDFLQLALLPWLVFGVLYDTTGSPAWVVPACMAPGVILDAFEHANLSVDVARPFWRAWDRVVNNPHFHAWHHDAEGARRDGNYGNALTVWDRLFGTCVSGDGLPARFGLEGSARLEESAVGLQLLRGRSP